MTISVHFEGFVKHKTPHLTLDRHKTFCTSVFIQFPLEKLHTLILSANCGIVTPLTFLQ